MLLLLPVACLVVERIGPLQKLPWEESPFRGRQLDRGMRHAWWLPNFLTEQEIDHLRGFAAKSPDRSKAYESGDFGARVDNVLAGIDDRVSNLTGIIDGVKMRLTINRPWNKVKTNNQLQNLHHDRFKKPSRVVTLIVYLSDADSDGAKSLAAIRPPCFRDGCALSAQ